MGNRAIIRAKGNNSKAVYLHWNGGRDSVEAFLKYCELREFPGFDDDYGVARFCQVVGNFFGSDGLSIGVTDYTESMGDNGVYVIKGWEIVDRTHFNGIEQNKHNLQEMLIEIDNAQPEKQQLGGYLRSKDTPTAELQLYDAVYTRSLRGEIVEHIVVGIGEDKMINGCNVLGIPYVDIYSNDEGDYSKNINNYILNDSVRLVVE